MPLLPDAEHPPVIKPRVRGADVEVRALALVSFTAAGVEEEETPLASSLLDQYF